jgi:signal transduction histidine kinase
VKLNIIVPVFVKTIRFRLAVWYLFSMALLFTIFIIGVNTAMQQSQPKMPSRPYPGDTKSWNQVVQDERERYLRDLRIYSVVWAGVVLIIGAAGGYILARFMLKPVDEVTALAGRISHTNLKERIRHHGPNDEVKRLSDTFDNMLSRLDDAFESQKQFIQDASHELRTPIAIAQTNIEVMEMKQRASSKDYRHLLDLIKMSLERMNDINSSLLMLSENSHESDRWAQVDIAVLLQEVKDETEMHVKSAEIDMLMEHITFPLLVKGDAMHLKRAILNLVDNAIKYNRPGGSIKLSAYLDYKTVIIQVADTGIGIEDADIQHIFDRFYRVEKSRSREQGGSGLGLSMVKKIIEDHGGCVTVESVPNQGSTFHIVLPHIE